MERQSFPYRENIDIIGTEQKTGHRKERCSWHRAWNNIKSLYITLREARDERRNKESEIEAGQFEIISEVVES